MAATTKTKKTWKRTAGWGALAGAMLLSGAGCLSGAFEGLAGADAWELSRYESCEDLEVNLKERSSRISELQSFAAVTGNAWSPAGFDASTPGADSATNNQERGVDEADIFKVDERFAYALHGGNLVIAEATGEGSGESFQAQAGRLLSETPIDGTPFAMHLSGDRAMVLARSSRSEIKEHFLVGAVDRDESVPVFKVILFDISDRARPALLREVLLEGSHVASRRIGGTVHVAVRADLSGLTTNDADGKESWLESRLSSIKGATVDAWMPTYYDVKYGAAGQKDAKAARCSCRDTWQSPAASGDDLLTIYSFNIKDGDSTIANTSVVGDGGHLYASVDKIVVAFAGQRTPTPTDEDSPDQSFSTTDQATYLHQFDVVGEKVEYEASGQVDGWILNQFSMSEYEGVLRVATMTGTRGLFDGASHVFTLRPSSKARESFSVGGQQPTFLKIIGEARDIGVAEDLYAARFQGNRGYLITFQQTDPLWVVDLTKPESPRVLGELFVPGYSTYIHPLEGSRLLAVGRAGWEESEGIKLSLFDVRDGGSPSVIEERAVGDSTSTSEALDDHRAFNYMTEDKLLAIPMSHVRADSLQLYEVNSGGFDFRGHVDHETLAETGSPTVRRSLKSGRYLWSLSEAGIVITDLDTLDEVGAVDLKDGVIVD
jgi:hypothetical protein